MNRRDFIRQGSLWVVGALVVEPVVKRLWAFPTNPLGLTRPTTVTLADVHGIHSAWMVEVLSQMRNTRFPCHLKGDRLVVDVTLKPGDLIELTYVPNMA